VKNFNSKISKKEDFIMADKTIVCKDCGSEFVFTEGEQAFYAEKGFTNDPVRCPNCRRAKKQQRNNQ
jgi:DNA-directed RNA polymerase subunit RPC12/RpoP